MRWILGLVWIAFIAYALLLAPGQSPGSDPIFKELITLQSKEPWLLTVFSWLGIFPAVYACMLLRTSVKERGGRVPAWPFVILSFGLGAFALLPYYAWSSSANRASGYATLHFGRQRESGIGRVAAHKLTHVSPSAVNAGDSILCRDARSSGCIYGSIQSICLCTYHDD